MVDTLLESSEKAYLPKVASPTNHGHTTAAWVTVSVVMIGAVVSAVAVVSAKPWLCWVGLAVIVVGLVVGRLLKMLGLGQPEPSGPARGSVESGSDIDPSSKEQR